MLIKTARRAEAEVKALVAMTNRNGFDTAELREALAVSRAIKAALSAFQTNAALIVSRTERHGDGGAGVLAETAGLSRRDAHERVRAAETIAATPSIRDAVESGRVTEANARRLAEAVNRTSAEAVEADGGLLTKAETLRPEDFARESRRWTADRQDDGGEREYQRLRAKRSLHIWDADDGTVQMHGVFDPVTGKRIGKRLRAEAGRMYDADKKAATRGGELGELPDAARRTFKQCMADALDNHTSHTLSATGRGRATDQPAGTGPRAGHLGDSTTGTGPDRGADATTSRVPRTGANPGKTLTRDTSTGRDSGTSAGPLTNRNPNTSPASASDTDTSKCTGGCAVQPGDSAAGTGSGAGQPGGPSVSRSFADISVIAHVDRATGNLIAELPDGARLPAAVLEELACNARLTGLVYDTAGTPIWRAKSSRTATEGQRQSLLNRWGGCFHCAADPDMCQIHHIVPVSAGGATKIDNMVPVCWDCHNNIHHHHWQIRKHPDGHHSLHPPKSTHHGPARAPERPRLFTQDGPEALSAETQRAAAPASDQRPRAGPSGPATARAALHPRAVTTTSRTDS